MLIVSADDSRFAEEPGITLPHFSIALQGGEMTWKFDVVATKERRLLSRILQAFENQMVNMQMFVSQAAEETVHITCVFSSEQDKAYRLEALLYRLQNICSIDVTEMKPVTSPDPIWVAYGQEDR